ncbi:MAG TPA: hypothetical protein VFF07_00895 [Actinomycetota bacterium]|nr:hypothetical protein [Actinomycetota bacterium]
MFVTHGWWMLSEAIFWVALLGLVVWIVSGLGRSRAPERRDRQNAGAVLEDRFARGDISVEEFRERGAEIGRFHTKEEKVSK